MFSDLLLVVALLIAAILLPVGLSFVVEGLRRPPEEPKAFVWDPTLTPRYTTLAGVRIRFVIAGTGPTLVLLHTLRTDLNVFQKVLPTLARSFQVVALDYPGHGFSDIPDTDYRPELFVRTVESFLDDRRIERATLAGISIGATIALLVAANRNPRMARVVAINPYDYGRGLGVGRGNIVARALFQAALVPVVGETVMRFRNPVVERAVFAGGVADQAALPEKFLREMYAVGSRRGHYRAFLNLIRHAHHWEDALEAYPRIGVPVCVIYGERDWSYPAERRRTVQAIPGAEELTVASGGHFLSLDQPKQVVDLVKEFALRGAELPGRGAG